MNRPQKKRKLTATQYKKIQKKEKAKKIINVQIRRNKSRCNWQHRLSLDFAIQIHLSIDRVNLNCNE